MVKKLNRFTKFWRKFLRDFHLTARKITVIVIAAAIAVVAGATLAAIFLNPEAATKRKIDSLAHDYYENYYYEKIQNSVADFDTIMPKYATTGMTKVPLRQLLLFDNGRHLNEKDALGKYCDIDATYIQIFPEEPYAKQNYRVEYIYSCNF